MRIKTHLIRSLLSALSTSTSRVSTPCFRWGKIRNVEYNPIYFETRDTGLIENKIIQMMSQARRHSTLLRDSARNSSLSLMPPKAPSRRCSLAVGVEVPAQRTRCLRKLLSANVLTVEPVRPDLAELSCHTLQTLVSQESIGVYYKK